MKEEDKKERLLKRLKNIEGKNKNKLKAIKDQGKKQLKVLTEKLNKEVGFQNVYFKNVNPESIRVYMKLKNKIKRLNPQNFLAMVQVSIMIILPFLWA